MEKIYSKIYVKIYFIYIFLIKVRIRQHVFDNNLKYISMTPKYIFVAKSCVYRIFFYYGNETHKSERMSERGGHRDIISMEKVAA